MKLVQRGIRNKCYRGAVSVYMLVMIVAGYGRGVSDTRSIERGWFGGLKWMYGCVREREIVRESARCKENTPRVLLCRPGPRIPVREREQERGSPFSSGQWFARSFQ